MEDNKRDVQFSMLQTIAILLVVIGHKGGGLDLAIDWFPIYSYHMPLWIFISGYFLKEDSWNNIFKFCKKKVMNLVIPFFIINSLYGIIVGILQYREIVNYNVTLDFHSFFIEPWQTGTQFGLDLAGWYVLALFLIEVIYVVIRKILSRIVKNEYVITVVFLAMGMLGVKLAYVGYRTGVYLTLVRVLYGMFFFEAGYLYKTKFKGKYKVNNVLYFVIVFVMEFTIRNILNINTQIVMWNAEFNNFESNIIAAFIVPIPGILFWVRICYLLVPSVKDSKLIDYISRNTWTIMLHHQFVFFVMNYTLFKIHSLTNHFQDFSVESFRTNPWYGYPWKGTANSFLLYIFMGIAIPLVLKKILSLVKDKNRLLKGIYKIF